MKTNPSTTISNLRLAAGRWFMTIVLLCVAGLRAAEPTFTNVTTTVAPGLPQVGISSVAWGDYDNDGRLDFLITGGGTNNYNPQLWRNTGSGFVNVTATVAPGLPGVRASSVAWADYDNDGRLDFFLTGSPSQIWRNTGSGFTNVTATVALGLPRAGRSAWGDFDNDGRLDFFITGEGDDLVAQLWQNTGSGFTNVTASVAPGLRGVVHSFVAWGDYDNDGRLDFLITGGVDNGDGGYAPRSQLWRNTGSGFTNVTASVVPGLPAVMKSSVAWGDYDNDGRLDFFLAGITSFCCGEVSQLWRNTGSGFTNVTATAAPGLPGVIYPSVAWGDYDNDGRLDFLLTGYSYSAGNISQLWRNTGSGFTNVTASVVPGLPAVTSSSVAWGDYDNDGRLDFLITGRTNFSDSAGVSQLWRNNTVQTNPPPAVITGLPDIASQSSVALNARINPLGQVATAWFIWGDSTNYGQVTAAQPMGNGSSFTNFSATLTGLSTGVTYYCRAVGSNEQGGVFISFEQRFMLAAPGVTTTPATNINPTSVALNGHVNPNNFPAYGWFDWGLTPACGQVTPVQFFEGGWGSSFSLALSGLESATTYYFRAVASNSLGVTHGPVQSFFTATFASVSVPGLASLHESSVTWADYDNDGRLDFLVTGFHYDFENDKIRRVQLWRNTGSGFTNGAGIPGVYASSAAWSDYDNDGRLDLLLTGFVDYDGDDGISLILRNTGSGFSNVTATVAPGLLGVGDGSVAWGDYDNDGWLDFIITGFTIHDDQRGVSEVWRNTGHGFTNVTATVAPGLPGVLHSSVAWGDYDNDGWLDFLLTGYGYSQLWRNTGSGFVDVTATVVPGLSQINLSAVAWADYDNDGKLDFIITGFGGNSNAPVCELWRNTGSGFSNVTTSVAPGLQGTFFRSVAWGDYDNDGRHDLLLRATPSPLFPTSKSSPQLWRNTGAGFTNVTDLVAPGLLEAYAGTAAWGDYDNDGRLDLFLAGYPQQILRNDTPITNTPPSAPTGLAMTATANAVMLSWNSATDGQTPASGLTYNVRAGTTPGGNNLLSAHVNATNGFRRVPALGNAMLRHSLPLTGLTNGQTVYWSVQAVDTSFAGGLFATETSVVSLPQLRIIRPDATNTLVSWSPPTFGWVLQQSTQLNGSNWTTTASGSANPAILPATNAAQFYRLSKP